MTTRQLTDRLPRGIASLVTNIVQTAIIASSGIIAAIYSNGRTIGERIFNLRAELSGAAHGFADEARLKEEAPQESGSGGLTILGLSGIALILVIGGVFMLCILPVCIIIILVLLGPVIGDINSQIIEDI